MITFSLVKKNTRSFGHCETFFEQYVHPPSPNPPPPKSDGTGTPMNRLALWLACIALCFSSLLLPPNNGKHNVFFQTIYASLCMYFTYYFLLINLCLLLLVDGLDCTKYIVKPLIHVPFLLFRSESPSQVFITVLSWLCVILKNINPVNWSKIFLAYDNMCHLDGLQAAKNLLPWASPWDRAWISIKKIIDRLHISNHKDKYKSQGQITRTNARRNMIPAV